MKFISLTYLGGEKTYVKADAIVQLEKNEYGTNVYTINDNRPMPVKENMEEILGEIESASSEATKTPNREPSLRPTNKFSETCYYHEDD